jgi:polar amino acid transport system permease protein
MPRWLAHLIVVAAFGAAVAAAFARVNYEWNWAAVWDYRQKFFQGWLVTVALSLAALATSIVIGGLTAMMLRSGRPLLEAAARVYVELIRGTPLLVQLLIGFYVVATAVGLDNRYVAGVLLLSLFSGAYMAEIFRGGLTAMMLRSGRPLLEAAARVYVELIRGTPLLVQLLIGFYVVATAVGLENRYVAGVLLLSLFSGAYMAEIFRGGLDAIPKAQIDSGRAIGLTPWQSLRLVVLPQAVRLVLPAVAGQLVSLVKDSSLLSVIAISEFTLAAQEVNSFTYSTLESYLPLAAGYLLLTLPLSALARWLERRFRYETA